MVGVFACPECGRELSLEGISPGRQVQCQGCSTWVEVPFLPRASGWKRRGSPRRRAAWEFRALRAAVAFAVAAMIGLASVRMIGGRVRSGHERVLAVLVASATSAESGGRYDVALRESEAAVALARKVDPVGSGRLAGLIRHRDRVSVREARSRLAAVAGLDPDRAVGESLTLVDRARADPALASMAGAIKAGLADSRLRQAEADLETARSAFDRGRSREAFEAADRLHGRAGRLAESDAARFREQARGLIEAVVARDGAAIAPVAGRFIAGSPGAYTAILDRAWSDALRLRGYLPQPRQSPWRAVWDQKAPALAVARVVETQDGLYLQSKNRTTQIDGTFELTVAGRPPWATRAVVGTRVPLPDLPAYLAGHLATAGRRDSDAERRFHDDALALFAEQSARGLRGVPPRDPSPRQP